MKVVYLYDGVTGAYAGDYIMELSPDTGTYDIPPVNSTPVQPVGFHTPVMDTAGDAWIEGAAQGVLTELSKTRSVISFNTSNRRVLDLIAVLETKQTNRLLREAALGNKYAVDTLTALDGDITSLRAKITPVAP